MATEHLGRTQARSPHRVTWPQALAWRMERHLLDPIGSASVEDVVRRLCGVQAQVASSAEQAVRVRRRASSPGEVGAALADGRLIKTWAMRGTLHLLPADEAGVLLSLMAAGRSWERGSWVKYFGVTPEGVETLRLAVREILDRRVLTREELVAEVTARPGLDHVGAALRSGWGTLLKPVAWQGDLCFGPNRGAQVTFTHPTSASARWRGLPTPDEAAPRAIAAYLGVFGPATFDAFGSWLAGGWFGKRKLAGWYAELADELAEVDLDGERAFVMAADLDGLLATRPSRAVRLLPGFDQYVLGAGTADGHVTPAARRRDVSRQSGWISPVVVVGGVVAGTWALDRDEIRIDWFREAGPIPAHALDAEVERWAGILGRSLRTTVTPT
jgi:Winged helix DNA-binding domain